MKILQLHITLCFLFLALWGKTATAQEIYDPQQHLHQLNEAYEKGDLTKTERIEKQLEVVRFANESRPQIKCLTGILYDAAEYEINYKTLTLKKGTSVKEIQETIYEYISPSGWFKLYYYKDGTHQVPSKDLNQNNIPDYIERAGEYADTSFTVQITQLGFKNPITPPYSIYFRDLGSGIYGYTELLGNSTRIVVHSNFAEIINSAPNTDPVSMQLGALKVTIAHEFKHAIQYVYNFWAGYSQNWGEMDATMMEEIVFDEVNDYYNYLPSSLSIFKSPTKTVIPGSYEDITFALYFAQRFGNEFWVTIWERIELDLSKRMMVVIKEELESMGLNYEEVIADNYLWHLASGDLAISGFGFEEAANYPTPTLNGSWNGRMTKPSEIRTKPLNPPILSAGFYRFTPSSAFNQDINYYNNHTGKNARIALLIKTENSVVVHNFTHPSIGYPVYAKSIPNNAGSIQDIYISVLNPGPEAPYSFNHRFLIDSSTNPGSWRIGDINEDAKLDINDIEMLANLILKPSGFQPFDSLIANVTLNDNLISLLDLAHLYQFISGTRSGFDIDEDGNLFAPEADYVISANPYKTPTDDWAIFLKPDTPADGSGIDALISLETNFGSNQVNGAYFEIIFPSDSLQFESLTYDENVFQDAYYTHSVVSDSIIKIIVAGQEPLPSTNWINLAFKNLKVPEQDSVLFRFNNVQIDEFDISTLRQYGAKTPVPTNVGVNTEHPQEITITHPDLIIGPNPFNPSTNLTLLVPEKSAYSLHIYTILGQKVATLTDHQLLSSGKHTFIWNAHSFSSGIYIAVLTNAEFTLTKKMTLLK